MKGSIAKLLLAVSFMTAGMLTFTPCAEAASPIKIAYAFSGKPAAYPGSGLIADASGNLYGTSTNNGPCCGLVFKMTPQAGGSWLFRVIYEFHGSDGSYPNGLIIDSAGRLYGTTYEGGAYGFGTVFVLYSTKNGWVEEVLHSFGNLPDFQQPQSSLMLDAAGNLYGTAPAGGTNTTYCPSGCGGVFKLSRSGSQFEETELYNFTGLSDGSAPESNVIFDTAGNLYGTASTSDSPGNWGTVFELSPSNSGEWTEKTLYTFTGAADGAIPLGGLIFDGSGNLYGTTNRAANSTGCNGVGCGTVFELSPDVAGNWTFNVLLAFDGSNGGWPRWSLVSDASGNLYGPASFGGANGLGVVFKLSQSSGTWTETFASFNSKNGANPDGPLLLQNGLAYGTAADGGKGYGVIFDIKL
jgi:uncharacterized repeat protein (TIGR03803 family)